MKQYSITQDLENFSLWEYDETCLSKWKRIYGPAPISLLAKLLVGSKQS